MPRSEHDNRTNSSVKSTHLRSVICGQPTSALTQPMGDSVQLTLRVARQVCVLGQVPAQQPVGIFTGATLPRAVRIGKENLDRKPPSQMFVLGSLVASIVGQGLGSRAGTCRSFLANPSRALVASRLVHPAKINQARRPLHQRSDRRSIAGALDEIAFPVARHRAGGHGDGPVGNRRHMGNLAALVRAARQRSACLARLPQRRQQLTAQRTTGQHI